MQRVLLLLLLSAAISKANKSLDRHGNGVNKLRRAVKTQ